MNFSPLSPAAGALLLDFSFAHGRPWKTRLRSAWLRQDALLAPELRALRASHGRGWLNSVRLGSLQHSEVG